jgi:hypothetical protein
MKIHRKRRTPKLFQTLDFLILKKEVELRWSKGRCRSAMQILISVAYKVMDSESVDHLMLLGIDA